MCRQIPPGADPVRTVLKAATAAAVRTGAALDPFLADIRALDPFLADIRAVEAAAAEAAVRTLPDAAGAEIRRGDRRPGRLPADRRNQRMGGGGRQIGAAPRRDRRCPGRAVRAANLTAGFGATLPHARPAPSGAGREKCCFQAKAP